MENRKLIKRFLAFGLATFLLPVFVSAYAEHTTHPALTDETVDFFNHFYPELALTSEEKERLKMGSIDEDAALRFFNHFYDPVRNVGLLSVNPTSKQWALDTQLQDERKNLAAVGALFSGYFGGAGDYSWERAVFDYVHKDKARALSNLGHILHLLQDATVPDHTRDDMHPPYFEQS